MKICKKHVFQMRIILEIKAEMCYILNGFYPRDFMMWRKHMETNVQEKLQLVLQGKLSFTSGNLAFNMLINKLKRKVSENPDCINDCIREIDELGSKYPKVVATDFAVIAGL